MLKIIQRAILPAMLLFLGIASLTFGVRHHAKTVFEDKEIEISIVPPDMPLPPSDFNGPPNFMPPRLPPELQKVKRTIVVGKDAPEMAMIRDVTIGGLVLTEAGELKRTYSGKPPSLCPT